MAVQKVQDASGSCLANQTDNTLLSDMLGFISALFPILFRRWLVPGWLPEVPVTIHSVLAFVKKQKLTNMINLHITIFVYVSRWFVNKNGNLNRIIFSFSTGIKNRDGYQKYVSPVWCFFYAPSHVINTHITIRVDISHWLMNEITT